MPIDSRDVVRSFYRVRQALGALGLALPAILIGATWAMGEALPPSLSDFYHTGLRDLFVGILTALGLFLLTYLGHLEPTAIVSDRNVSTLAGLGAIGTALFPNSTLDACSGAKLPPVDPAGALHVASAGLFFVMAAVFCLVLFRRSDRAVPDAGKRRRNRVYLACGWIIVGALGLLAVYFVVLSPDLRCDLRALRPVLWIEVAAVAAFGLSWLVKGRAVQSLAGAPIRMRMADDEEAPPLSRR